MNFQTIHYFYFARTVLGCDTFFHLRAYMWGSSYLKRPVLLAQQPGYQLLASLGMEGI
jgi:hypothetical protein